MGLGEESLDVSRGQSLEALTLRLLDWDCDKRGERI